jgi:hypothetical protein
MTKQDELKLARTGTWTDDEKQRLLKMHKDGFPTDAIAKALGRQHRVTAAVLVMTQKKEAKQTERLRKGWTANEVATLESMIEAKTSHKEIAAKLKRSTSAIDQRAHKLRKAKAVESLAAKNHAEDKARAQTLAANKQQRATIFTAPMPQPPEIKPITLTPAQHAWAKPEPQTHRNAAWAAVAVAAGLAGFILGGLAQ